ncbi:MAG: NAD-dependent protein deacylase Cob2 [Candidatus Dormibacteraceae bacterium]
MTDLEAAAELIRAARRGVAFTGAGISQESGISTYRGAGGLWNTTSPKTSTIDFFMKDPAAYWEVARERGATLLAAHPNAAHLALVEMERAGHLAAVVTQNVDGLHLLAGSGEVIELHGTGREVVCLDCGNREPRSHVHARLDEEMPPRCLECGGGHLKPAAVFFGEAMPVRATARAFELAEACDLMLVVGSSLVVYPAAEVPLAARQRGAPLVIVNLEPTPFDHHARVIIRGRAGEVLPELRRLAAAA